MTAVAWVVGLAFSLPVVNGLGLLVLAAGEACKRVLRRKG
jgi:hypothetical protein